MFAHRLSTRSPNHEPLRVRLYVQPFGDRWVAMLVSNDVPPPSPARLQA